jgi:hypothetical protein
MGYTMVQLVEALHYKPEGHGFDSRWSHFNFDFNPPGCTMTLRSTQPLNRNEYQVYLLGVKVASA